jgi:hypothetical protein
MRTALLLLALSGLVVGGTLPDDATLAHRLIGWPAYGFNFDAQHTPIPSNTRSTSAG